MHCPLKEASLRGSALSRLPMTIVDVFEQYKDVSEYESNALYPPSLSTLDFSTPSAHSICSHHPRPLSLKFHLCTPTSKKARCRTCLSITKKNNPPVKLRPSFLMVAYMLGSLCSAPPPCSSVPLASQLLMVSSKPTMKKHYQSELPILLSHSLAHFKFASSSSVSFIYYSIPRYLNTEMTIGGIFVGHVWDTTGLKVRCLVLCITLIYPSTFSISYLSVRQAH